MRFLCQRQQEILHVIALRIVPEVATLTREECAELDVLVDDALSQREPGQVWMLGLFLEVVCWAPMLRYGRPLGGLDGSRQDAVLRWFEDAPAAIVRKGLWGVKALVFLGYYGLPSVAEKIRYRPSRNGNQELAA